MKPEHLTFNAANEKCVTFGGSLPSISDQADQGMVVNWGHFNMQLLFQIQNSSA